MYQPEQIRLVERMELSRRFNDRYVEVKDDPAVQLLAERVRAYQDSLFLLGLRDRDVQRGLPTGELIWRTVSYGLLFVVYLPLAIAGAPLHAPLGILLKLGGTRFSPRKDTIAATKLLGGFFLILILYAMVTAAALWFWSLPIAVATAVLLPISGWSFIHVVSRARTLTRLYATAAEMLLMRRQIKRLKEERRALCVIIHNAVDRLIPEDLERLFPSRSEELLAKSKR
jgi:hypothetical protein